MDEFDFSPLLEDLLPYEDEPEEEEVTEPDDDDDSWIDEVLKDFL